MLEIKNLHVSVHGKPILDGLTLTVRPGEVAAIMGPNGSGKSTLSYVIAGKPDYEVTSGEVRLDGENLLDLAPDERAAQGPVPRLPISDRNSRRRDDDLPEGVAQRAAASRAARADLTTPDFMRRVREASQRLKIDQEMLRRPLNVGFSGGEKKRMEILQMALLEPRFAMLDETDSGPRHRRAARRRRTASTRCATPNRAFLVITHYQRLLDHIMPDIVHVMAKGRIVKTGGPDSRSNSRRNGYRDYAGEAA